MAMKQNDNDTHRRKREPRKAEILIEEELRDEQEDGFISQAEVIELLHTIECHREAIACATDKFEYWLQSSGQLRDTWQRFLISGGVSAEDFRAFLNSKFRCRRVRQRRHLRLVSGRSRKPRKEPSRLPILGFKLPLD
jgi:hypothetical protein